MDKKLLWCGNKCIAVPTYSMNPALPCHDLRRERQYCAPRHRRLEFIMSFRTVAAIFVELCRQGKNFDVMRTMYAPDIVSVEGDGKETAGQEAVIKKSADWVSD